MSKSYRNGAFALGLVTGGGIALNLFLWLDYKAQNKSDAYPQNNSNANGNEVGSLWDRFIGTFVSPSDTLAQWIMAIFTIAVVVLVYRTLVTTQKMAADTREIGEAQVMAHLVPISISAGLTTFNSVGVEEYSLGIRLDITNVGSTPAYRVSARGAINKIKADTEWVAAKPRDVAPNEGCQIKFDCEIGRVPVTIRDNADILSVYLRFDTVFTRGTAKEPKRVRFDYRITSDRQGKTLANRI